tara:strand:+ start:3865 stop:4302 length:438 start_codon:yes stop_codon:yes gene_type:complete
MISIKQWCLIPIFAVLAFSCKDNNKVKEDTNSDPMKSVVAVHDELMDKMGTISKLVGQLKTKVDTTEQGKVYEKAMKDLQEANQEMMVWMQTFGTHFEVDEIMEGKALTKEKQLLLGEDGKSIEALKEKFNSSIERGKQLLKEAN